MNEIIIEAPDASKPSVAAGSRAGTHTPVRASVAVAANVTYTSQTRRNVSSRGTIE